MNEYIKQCFPFLTSCVTDEHRKHVIDDFINSYDDSYREKLCKITDSNLSETEITELYNESINNSSLETDDAIAYAFALNKNLPSSIVNGLCYETTPDADFYEPLFKNHRDKMNSDVLKKVYDAIPFVIQNYLSHLKYLYRPITKEDLPFSNPVMHVIALKEFDKDDGRKHVSDDEFLVYRYLTDKHFIDDIISNIEKSGLSKERISTEILNNTFIDEERRNQLFDVLEYNPKKLLNPTPYMVERIYEFTTETIFGIGLDRYSPKSKEESEAYHSAIFLLGDLVRTQKLTAGMELNLMQMLIDRKDRTSEHLTGELVRSTHDPRVLHLALQLKSTNDKDTAINNKHLAREDILVVARKSQKIIETDLRKGQWISEKHILRLIDFSKRTTLPDDIYQTMLKAKDSRVGVEITKSKYTPKNILELALKQSLDPKNYTRLMQEMQARLMLFSLNNNLPIDKSIELIRLIEINLSASNNRNSTNNKANQRQHFKKENCYLEEYKEGLNEMVSQLTNEDCKKAVIETIKDLNETESLISDHNSESDFSKFSEKIIRQKMTDIAYTFTNNHRSAFSKTMLYLNLEKTAKEFLTLKEELDNRQILNKVEETKIER